MFGCLFFFRPMRYDGDMPLMPANATFTHGTYIIFLNCGVIPGGKTNRYEVWSKGGEEELGDKLGEIRWFGRWRKYSWYPNADTIYEEVCMQEITDFLKQVNKEHREKRRAANV